jgi:hypothetical protein
VTRCHSKWWRIRLRLWPLHIIFWEPIEIRLRKKDAQRWLPCRMYHHVVWHRGIIRYQAAACIFCPDGGRKFLLNTDTFLPDYMVSHTRRLWSSLHCRISQDGGSSPPLCTSSILDGPSRQGVSCKELWCVLLGNWNSVYHQLCH